MKEQNSFYLLRVKIWLESGDAKSSEREWRGEIKHLETGKVAYFRRLDGFPDGLQRLGIANSKNCR